MALGLCRARTFLRLDDFTAEDDFDVLDDEKRIGRVYFQPGSRQPWRWSLSLALVRGKSGRAESRSQALNELSMAYSEIQSEPKSSEIPQSPLRRNLQTILRAEPKTGYS